MLEINIVPLLDTEYDLLCQMAECYSKMLLHQTIITMRYSVATMVQLYAKVPC